MLARRGLYAMAMLVLASCAGRDEPEPTRQELLSFRVDSCTFFFPTGPDMQLDAATSRLVFAAYRQFRAEDKVAVATFMVVRNSEVPSSIESAGLLRKRVMELNQGSFFKVNSEPVPGLTARNPGVPTERGLLFGVCSNPRAW